MSAKNTINIFRLLYYLDDNITKISLYNISTGCDPRISLKAISVYRLKANTSQTVRPEIKIF